MSNAFDGAGDPYRGPTFRAVLLLGAAILLAVAVSWLGVSWAMNHTDLPSNVGTPQILQGESQGS